VENMSNEEPVECARTPSDHPVRNAATPASSAAGPGETEAFAACQM
jgi:hypothetical protein